VGTGPETGRNGTRRKGASGSLTGVLGLVAARMTLVKAEKSPLLLRGLPPMYLGIRSSTFAGIMDGVEKFPANSSALNLI